MLASYSQNLKALRLQECFSLKVVLDLIVVTRSVKFNDHHSLNAGEIGNVRPNDMLPSKLVSTQAPAPNKVPQPPFAWS